MATILVVIYFIGLILFGLAWSSSNREQFDMVDILAIIFWPTTVGIILPVCAVSLYRRMKKARLPE